MAEVIFRVEKNTDDKKTLYVEFQQEARNVVLRLWNTVNSVGLYVAHKERENFHSAEDVAVYMKNARKQYKALGFKEPEKVAAVPTEKTPDGINANDLD